MELCDNIMSLPEIGVGVGEAAGMVGVVLPTEIDAIME